MNIPDQLKKAIDEACTTLSLTADNIRSEIRRGVDRWDDVPELLDQRRAALQDALRAAKVSR